MNWLQKISQIIDYPMAGSVVSGLAVRSDVPNTDSIGAGCYDYEVLDGIREVPLSPWGDYTPNKSFCVVNDIERCHQLAEEIKQSGEISPLIIAMNGNDQWIVEGGHRLSALYLLQVQSFPALIVIDKDEEME